MVIPATGNVPATSCSPVGIKERRYLTCMIAKEVVVVVGNKRESCSDKEALNLRTTQDEEVLQHRIMSGKSCCARLSLGRFHAAVNIAVIGSPLLSCVEMRCSFFFGFLFLARRSVRHPLVLNMS